MNREVELCEQGSVLSCVNREVDLCEQERGAV